MDRSDNVTTQATSSASPRSDRSYLTWRRHAWSFLYWIYGRIPFSTDVYAAHSRCTAMIEAWTRVNRSGVSGDYIEFGVFGGDTFKLAIRTARRAFSGAGGFAGRFIACDSFQGLPDAPSLSAPENPFAAGEYSMTQAGFEKKLRAERRRSPVIVIPGWFNDTLTDETRARHGINKIALANVDCDLYESAVPCLSFLTPLVQTGTILMFDDFYSFRSSMQAGEALAAKEWLRANPGIKLVPLRSYAPSGMMFIVNRTSESSPFYLSSD